MAPEAVRSERHVALALARVGALSHVRVPHPLVQHRVCVELVSVVRVQNLLDRDPAKDLKIHQRQEVRLGIFVLRHLRVIVDRKLHIREVIHCCRRIEIHYIAADAILGDLAPRLPFRKLPFLLFTLCKHLIVDRACRKVRHTGQGLQNLSCSQRVLLSGDCIASTRAIHFALAFFLGLFMLFKA